MTTVAADTVPIDLTLDTPHRARLRAAFVAVAVAALIGCCAVAGLFAAKGGQWYVVSTPSMGKSAPVGTLLWVEPVKRNDMHRGDIISFQPPGSNAIYSHRIYSISPNGTIRTKGDVNDVADPWTITAKNVRGKTVLRWWGVGWLVRALPILLGGGIVLSLLIRRYVRPRNRVAAATFGASLLLSVSLIWLRPLVRGELVSLTSNHGHGVAKVISTGLLPGELSAKGIQPVRLANGDVGRVKMMQANSSNHFVAHFSPDVPWWLWVLLIAVCFSPAVLSTLIRAIRAHARGGSHRRSGRADIVDSTADSACPDGESAQPRRPRPGRSMVEDLDTATLSVFRPTPVPRPVPLLPQRPSRPLPAGSPPHRPRPRVQM